jgi:signal peptidase I
MLAGRLARGVALQAVAMGLATAMLWAGVSGARFGVVAAGIAVALGARPALALDALLLARRAGDSRQLRFYNRWYWYVAAIPVLLLAEMVLSAGVKRLTQSFKVPSAAMEPTILAGDFIMVDKSPFGVGDLRRFDVVVFDYPENPKKSFVKRIVGLPGETIEIRAGKVWVNGAPVDEPHAHFDPENAALRPPRAELPPRAIPEGHYFVLGDNRNRSYDSRFWGDLEHAAIHGRARLIYFSWSGEEESPRWDRIGRSIE